MTWLHNSIGEVQLKCDGTQWHTGGEVKGKLANAVGSQYPSHYLGTWCIQHYYRRRAHLGCQLSTELTPPGRFKWTRPFHAKDKVWFLRVCHYISDAVYNMPNTLWTYRMYNLEHDLNTESTNLIIVCTLTFSTTEVIIFYCWTAHCTADIVAAWRLTMLLPILQFQILLRPVFFFLKKPLCTMKWFIANPYTHNLGAAKGRGGGQMPLQNFFVPKNSLVSQKYLYLCPPLSLPHVLRQVMPMCHPILNFN